MRSSMFGKIKCVGLETEGTEAFCRRAHVITCVSRSTTVFVKANLTHDISPTATFQGLNWKKTTMVSTSRNLTKTLF